MSSLGRLQIARLGSHSLLADFEGSEVAAHTFQMQVDERLTAEEAAETDWHAALEVSVRQLGHRQIDALREGKMP